LRNLEEFNHEIEALHDLSAGKALPALEKVCDEICGVIEKHNSKAKKGRSELL